MILAQGINQDKKSLTDSLMIHLKVPQIFVDSYAIAKRYKEVGVNVHVTMNSTKMKQLHGSCL